MGKSAGLTYRTIFLEEHGKLCNEDIQCILDKGICFRETGIMEKPVYLGIGPDMKASYFIGADWLDEKEGLSVVVHPKKEMENVDYFKMFMACLENELSSDYFSLIYGIECEKKYINCARLQEQITPLLLIHYLTVLKRLTKRGLRKDYVLQEENLQCKVKGRVLTGENLRMNVIGCRLDRCYCSFHEYTVDSQENRLLKKALLFTARFIRKFGSHDSFARLSALTNSLLAQFENVGDEIEIYQIRRVAANGLFKDYNEAVILAKKILRRFGYSIEKVNRTEDGTPVFWIDMSRLYEVYVYSLLNRAYGKQILFQVKGYHQCSADFIKLDENLIIDTKYKPRYENGNKGIIDDIRQVSAYARDEKIISHLSDAQPYMGEYPCLIIYPEKQASDDLEVTRFNHEESLLQKARKINGFRNFYKMGVRLPVKI